MHAHNGGCGRWRLCLLIYNYQGLHTDWCVPLAVFKDMSTTCRRLEVVIVDVVSMELLLIIELGVRGIGYEDVLPVGDGGGGGDEQDDDDEEADEDEDDDESVLSVNGADGERADADAVAVPVGWIELSLWPK